MTAGEGIVQAGGIFEIGPSSGTDYLINFDAQQLIFVSGEEIGYSSIPGDGELVTANYDRNRPIVKLADKLNGII